MDTGSVPSPASGQVLLRTLFLSLDPYMRGRMSDGPSRALDLPGHLAAACPKGIDV
jgi:NADPH-dependent curcumin reductase CurA